MSNSNLLGIETIKEIVDISANIRKNITKALLDKKFSFFEGVSLSQETIPLVQLIADGGALVALSEAKDLVREEEIELVEHVVVKHNVPQSEAGQFIRDGLEFFFMLFRFSTSAVDYFKSKKEDSPKPETEGESYEPTLEDYEQTEPDNFQN